MALKHPFLHAAACSVAALAGLPVPAFGQQAQASPAEAAARYEALAAEERAKAGDPAFDYALGTAASDAGHYGEAIVALQRVLARQPANAPARAELARAYALAGDIDTARAQFSTVVDDPTIPDPVRQRFTGFVRQFDKQIKGGGSDVSGFGEAAFGHDSNINSATQLTSITIPLFAALGPGTLGAGARAQKDEFYDLSAGVSAVSAVGRQDRVFGSLLGNWRDNLDSAAFDQASLTGTAGFAHTFASRDVVSFSGQVQKYWLSRRGYRTAFGGIAQYTHLLPGGMLDPGTTVRVAQLFDGGRTARVAIATPGQDGLDFTVLDGESKPVCPPAKARNRQCTWTPLYSGRFEIVLRNPSDAAAGYYLVID